MCSSFTPLQYKLIRDSIIWFLRTQNLSNASSRSLNASIWAAKAFLAVSSSSIASYFLMMDKNLVVAACVVVVFAATLLLLVLFLFAISIIVLTIDSI